MLSVSWWDWPLCPLCTDLFGIFTVVTHHGGSGPDEQPWAHSAVRAIGSDRRFRTSQLPLSHVLLQDNLLNIDATQGVDFISCQTPAFAFFLLGPWVLRSVAVTLRKARHPA